MMHRTLPLTGFIFATASLSLLHVSRAFAQQPTPEPTKQDAPKPESAKPAPAKTESQIKAGELFSEGRKLVEAGDYKQACPKFEQSLAVNFGLGAQFNLADCWEHIGRAASAQQLFQGVAASARAAGQADRAQVAQARADALEPRLLRLLIDVQATDPELVVRRNRIAVEKKVWGTATASDAGEYLIEAVAPGKKPWSTTVTVPASASQIISVSVPLLEPNSAEKPVEPKPTVSAPVEKSDPKRQRRNSYAYVIGGLGIASLGIATFFAIKYKSKNSDAKELCPDSVSCSQADIDRHAELVSDAKSFRTGAFIGFGVGAAALITSTALFLAPSSSSGSAFRAAPFVSADGSWGAVATGKF